MDAKVLLYDANDVKIGETFARRARQLVKRQRAEWVDGKQNAVRFVPDAEEWEAAEAAAEEEFPAVVIRDTISRDDGRLIRIAEQRLKKRALFIYHSIAFIPVWGMLVAICSGTLYHAYGADNSIFIFGLTTGAWITAYAIHIFQYVASRRGKYSSTGREDRRARKLAAEIALIKSEMRG